MVPFLNIFHAKQIRSELTCIMEHINTQKDSKERLENEREIDLGTSKAHCLPLGRVIPLRATQTITNTPSGVDKSPRSNSGLPRSTLDCHY
jgi:hypothetical protein